MRINDRKAEIVVFLEVLHKLKNTRLTSEMINAHISNKQSRIFSSVDLIQR